jgi:hypothetical protein
VVASVNLAGLRAAVLAFDPDGRPDPAWAAFAAATSPRVDLSVAAHRRAALSWLNAWGCRIRYPRAGEPDIFDRGLADWWARCATRLPGSTARLVRLSDRQIDAIGRCFAQLAAAPAGAPDRPRSLGPTAAAKLLYALRPQSVVPWDEAIAMALHGGRDGAAFAAHQRLAREVAARVLAEAAVDESGLATLIGRPGRPLTKMLDDYWYLALTRSALP